MKNLILLTFMTIVGLVFTSCTDNTQEYEKPSTEIHNIDKENSTSIDDDGDEDHNE